MLKALSMENGRSNRTATKPQRSTVIHLGALRKQKRKIKTPVTTQPAVMLMFNI